ncbi:transglycosylase SLT domain-containing protein [Patescibacteria group bacterium]
MNFDQIPINPESREKPQRKLKITGVEGGTEQSKPASKKPDKKEWRDQVKEKPTNGISRRNFIKTALAAAGAVGVETAATKTELGRGVLEKLGEFFRSEKETTRTHEPAITDDIQPGEMTIGESPDGTRAEDPVEIHPDNRKETIEYTEKEKAESLVTLFTESLDKLSQDALYFPKEVFTPNFFTAIEIQESRGKKDAESKSGAVGVMQVKPMAINDSLQYLNRLHRAGIIIDTIPPKEISDETMDEIKMLIKSSAEIGRVFGKLHFINNFDRYGVGADEFQQGDIKKAQRQLAAAYNGGHSVSKLPENMWSEETRNYAPSVMNYIKRLEDIQEAFDKLNVKSNTNNFAILIAIEMNRFKDSTEKYHWMNKKISDIKEMEEVTQQKLAEKHFKEILRRT